MDVSVGETCVESARKWLALALDAVAQFTKSSKTRLDIPIVVVGCKADAIVTSDIESLKRAKTIQGELRTLCMKSITIVHYRMHALTCDR